MEWKTERVIEKIIISIFLISILTTGYAGRETSFDFFSSHNMAAYILMSLLAFIFGVLGSFRFNTYKAKDYFVEYLIITSSTIIALFIVSYFEIGKNYLYATSYIIYYPFVFAILFAFYLSGLILRKKVYLNKAKEVANLIRYHETTIKDQGSAEKHNLKMLQSYLGTKDDDVIVEFILQNSSQNWRKESLIRTIYWLRN